jgi:hypothetical protein
MNTDKLLAEVERLRPLIAERAPGAETNRRLSTVVYDAMYSAGLFGMLAPRARVRPRNPPGRLFAGHRGRRADRRGGRPRSISSVNPALMQGLYALAC